jgi:hypothetical protein
MYIVYVGLRESLLVSLYRPHPTPSSPLQRLRDGPITEQIDHFMKTLFQSSSDTLFAPMVGVCYREILAAMLWVLLYGQRIIPQAMVNDVVRDDLIALNEIFSHELTLQQRQKEMAPLVEVLAIMSKSVDELVAIRDAKDKVSVDASIPFHSILSSFACHTHHTYHQSLSNK